MTSGASSSRPSATRCSSSPPPIHRRRVDTIVGLARPLRIDRAGTSLVGAVGGLGDSARARVRRGPADRFSAMSPPRLGRPRPSVAAIVGRCTGVPWCCLRPVGIEDRGPARSGQHCRRSWVMSSALSVSCSMVVAPSEPGSEDIESVDGPFGVGRGVVVVEVVPAVVGCAFEAPVELAGRPATAVGDDVVHVAVRRGDVAPDGVLAVAVVYLDGAAKSAGERAAAGHSEHGEGAVEQDGLQLRGAEPRGELGRLDDGAVGQLAQVAEAERRRAAP